MEDSSKQSLLWERTATYIPIRRDGTFLAAFIYIPKSYNESNSPLPVLWMHDRYHSALNRENSELDISSHMAHWLEKIIQNNYIVILVDARGTGSSYGTWDGPFSSNERLDSYDIMDWISDQHWCNGKLGMFGRSYRGITQYFAASTNHPNLKAVFPEMALFDLYSFAYSGGVFRHDFATKWGYNVEKLDMLANADKVDSDTTGALLNKARQDHKDNLNVYELFFSLPYKDSKFKGEEIYYTRNPASYLKEIQDSNVAFYHLGGWYDVWTKDTLLWFKNLNNPSKLKLGPWSHEGSDAENLADLHIKWFDYWLKDIKNGVMDGDPITYYTIGAQKTDAWRTTPCWPLKNELRVNYFLTNKYNYSNQGTLLPTPHINQGGSTWMDHRISYNYSSGKASRWSNGYGGNFGYRDMSIFDNSTLIFTTEKLDKDIEITGHIVSNIWIQSDNDNVDVFLFIEDVHTDGYTQYITEGNLRLSFQKQNLATFDNFHLPFHNCSSKDICTIPKDKPINLILDMLPISYVIKKNHKLQIRISFCDKDNALTPIIIPTPNIKLYCDRQYPSFINIPIIEE